MRIRTLFAALLVGAGVAVAPGVPAQADVSICDQYGSTTIQGRYVVQNNRWGTSATQCINVTSTGFRIRAYVAEAGAQFQQRVG